MVQYMDINVLELFYADAVTLNKPILPDFAMVYSARHQALYNHILIDIIEQII